MKVVLLTRDNKITVDKAIQSLKSTFPDTRVYFGEDGNKLPQNIIQELENDKPDILLSYLSLWVLPESILKNTKLWNINFHPAPPEYPGIGCYNFALYDEVETYGVTAHIMENKVDTGQIIDVLRFSVLGADSVYTLMIKSYTYLLELFNYLIKYISIHNNLPHNSNEDWKRKPYTRKELNTLCEITLNMTRQEIERRIRATVFPDKQGAYVEICGNRFEYKVNQL